MAGLAALPQRKAAAYARGAAEAGQPSLARTAAAAGLIFGSDSDVPVSEAPQAYADLLIRHCDLYAPNLAWTWVQPEASSPDPAATDPNVAFALAHGMRLTGAHFLWHEALPPWFEALNSKLAAERAALNHIQALSRHYAGRVLSWNVVNEAIEPRNHRPDGLRRSPLLSQLGPDFFEPVYHAARQADPRAHLLYNDYGMEMATEDAADRRRALLGLLDRLTAAKVPLDGVGLQTHIRLDGSRFDERMYRTFLAEIAARRLTIFITEMDVLDLQPFKSRDDQDQSIAAMYSAVLRTALDEPGVKVLVLWGLSDRYTWLTAESGPQYVRSDGLPNRPLPFDDNFRPKPAYTAVMSALKHAPRRAGISADGDQRSRP
ncbi:MAG: endo-1,4-beta-xylanase [Proteobacteria bacterium]|nr:endo-1,4-beta-xylanase [Pseudomonadota bacterium]